MPIDELKVDMSFTQNLHTVSGYHIVETMIMLSNKLNMQTVFEGVETPEQLQTIISLDNTSCIQGYIFAKPQHIRDINILQLETDFIKTYLTKN
jgi:diguanylate cyclase